MTASAQEISDRDSIVAVLHRYAAAIDARDWSALDEVFDADARLDYTAFGGPRGTPGEVVPWIRDGLSRTTVSLHLIGDEQIRIDGDLATSRCSLDNPMGLPDGEGGTRMISFRGHYADVLRRTPHGWRIVERVLERAGRDAGR